MTPQEKAHDLWMKFLLKQIDITGSGDGNLCVEMALIAVDEIQKELECAYNGEPITTNNHKEYWQEVKQEIEKL